MYKDNINAIEKVIENYFEGIFYGDVTKLASCFDDNVSVYGDINGSHFQKHITEYLAGVGNRQSPSELKETFRMEVIGIDIMGKIAMAKLHVPMLGYNYYDYVSLIKVNDSWKIVNKIFTNVA